MGGVRATDLPPDRPLLDDFAAALRGADAVAVADIWASRPPDTSITSCRRTWSKLFRKVRPEIVAEATGSVEDTAAWLAEHVAPRRRPRDGRRPKLPDRRAALEALARRIGKTSVYPSRARTGILTPDNPQLRCGQHAAPARRHTGVVARASFDVVRVRCPGARNASTRFGARPSSGTTSGARPWISSRAGRADPGHR